MTIMSSDPRCYISNMRTVLKIVCHSLKTRRGRGHTERERDREEKHLPLPLLLPPVLPVTKRHSVHTATKRHGRKESGKLRQVIEREWNAVQRQGERGREREQIRKGRERGEVGGEGGRGSMITCSSDGNSRIDSGG